MVRWFLVAAVLGVSGPAFAEVLSEREARKALFPVRGHVIDVSPKLSELEKKIVTGIIPLMAKQLRQPVRYYASVAYSPDDGMVHDALQAAMNHHSPEDADRAAIAACNALKSLGAETCRIAARVLPRKYKPRALTLSIDATVGFNRTYRKAKGPKSFAISRKSGAWAMGRTDEMALEACEKRLKPKDCEIVIRD